MCVFSFVSVRDSRSPVFAFSLAVVVWNCYQMRDMAASIASFCQNRNQFAPELNLTHQQLYQTGFVLEVISGFQP